MISKIKNPIIFLLWIVMAAPALAAGLGGLVKGAVGSKIAEESGSSLPANPLGLEVPGVDSTKEETQGTVVETVGGAVDGAKEGAKSGLVEGLRGGFSKDKFFGGKKNKKAAVVKPKISTENLQFRYDDKPVEAPLNNLLQEAPSLSITAFVIEGVVDKPERKITQQRVQEYADKALAAANNQMTIGQLDQLVNDITFYYRQQGFIMARAFVPEQTVLNGIVKIIVREGMLEKMMFTGNENYSDKRLGYYFRHQVGEPVYKQDVEAGLLRLSRYPGTKTTGLFVPGGEAGSSVLVIQSHMEDRLAGVVSLDNWGSEYTGKNRLRLVADWNNPSGGADKISFMIQQTLRPANSSMLTMGYDRPIGNTSEGWREFLNPLIGDGLDLGFDYQSNDFDVGEELDDLNVAGDWSSTSINFNKRAITKKHVALNFLLDLAKKESSSSQSSVLNGKDKLTVLKYGVDFSISDGWKGGGVNYLGMYISKGLDGTLGAMDSQGDCISSRIYNAVSNVCETLNANSPGIHVGGDFSKTNLVLQRLQFLPRQQSLLVKLETQSTSDLLVALEQFSMGGIQSAPGYPVGEFLMDEVTRFTFEFTSKSNFSGLSIPLNNLQVTAYYIWARGELNDPLPNDKNKAILATLGGRAVFNPYPRVTAQFDLALPLGDPEPSNDKSFQIYFNLGYSF